MNGSPSHARDESRRLETLHSLNLLDTAPEADFDALARLATSATGCRTSFIALIDAERMWVKASVGSIPCVVPRNESLCDTIIRSDAPLVVQDLAADPRFHDHWIIAAGSRFYAGCRSAPPTPPACAARWGRCACSTKRLACSTPTSAALWRTSRRWRNR